MVSGPGPSKDMMLKKEVEPVSGLRSSSERPREEPATGSVPSTDFFSLPWVAFTCSAVIFTLVPFTASLIPARGPFPARTTNDRRLGVARTRDRLHGNDELKSVKNYASSYLVYAPSEIVLQGAHSTKM